MGSRVLQKNTSKGYGPVVGRVKAFNIFVDNGHIDILPYWW